MWRSIQLHFLRDCCIVYFCTLCHSLHCIQVDPYPLCDLVYKYTPEVFGAALNSNETERLVLTPLELISEIAQLPLHQ
jgi:hypothetical protein